MAINRPDLDGVRLHELSGPDIWLVFHGRRHRITSLDVYGCLFSETENLLINPDTSQIELGPELGDGACLIRFDGRPTIYLLTSVGGYAEIMNICSYESFCDFGFDMTKVRDTPHLLGQNVKEGPPIMSAPDRAQRAE